MGVSEKSRNFAFRMTYDEALKELRGIAEELEKGGLISMEVYSQKAKRAQELAALCESMLKVKG